MEPSENGNLKIQFHDDDTFTTSKDLHVPYVMVLEMVPISGPDNWSYEAIANWFSSINPEKLLAGIILMILAFIIFFLRIKINRGDEEIIIVSEHIQEEVDGIFFQTVGRVTSFFNSGSWMPSSIVNQRF